MEKSISLDPDFADAYSVLSFVQMSDGKPEEAVPTLQKAISLDPRNERYSLNLAQLYMMQRKYDDAIKLLQELSNTGRPPFNTVAAQRLSAAQSMKEMASLGQQVEFRMGGGSAADSESAPAEKAAGPPPASGPVIFLKGKLQVVDCSATPGAEIVVISAAKTWKMHVRDVKHTVLIGADSFSCGWTNQKVAVNFRKTGDGQGEIVSLELQ